MIRLLGQPVGWSSPASVVDDLVGFLSLLVDFEPLLLSGKTQLAHAPSSEQCIS